MKKALLIALCTAMPMAGVPEVQAAGQVVQAPVPAPRYDYRIGFWRNLHHMLYAQATSHPAAGKVRRIELRPPDAALLQTLTADERDTWSHAVAYYAANLASKNLLFDDELVETGIALSAAGSSGLEPSAVPAELRQVLMRAAPVYRKYWWPRHQRISQQWRDAVEPLLTAHGSTTAARMATLYQSDWPAAPVEANLTVYANSAGAYTTVEPTRITIATGDPTYQGPAALEMLMHESAHGLVGALRKKLQGIVDAETAKNRANAKGVRRDLWHELLFFMTGSLVADAIPGYVPYAAKNELWRYAWPGPDRDAIERHMSPYIAGEVTLDAALTGLVRELAAVPAQSKS